MDILNQITLPGEHHHTGFMDLICDAIFQYRLSCEAAGPYGINRHARASIMASAFSIECCANCLMSRLGMARHLAEDLDALRPLSKCEAYLQLSKPEVQLNRGDSRVGKIMELIKLRNDFVHPKLTTSPIELSGLKEEGDMVMWPMTISPKVFPGLKIAKVSLFWMSDDARSALAAVLDFYRYFFTELLDYNAEQINEMVLQRAHVRIGESMFQLAAQFDEFREELQWAAQQGFKMDFLGYTSA